VVNTFNCQDSNSWGFKFLLTAYILKKELVIEKMHIVERVDFEIYLFDLGNNFVKAFNGTIVG
jgi:hypothetical protein